MTDKVQKIISNLKDVIDDLGVTSPHRLPIIEAIECLQEEPVSKEIEVSYDAKINEAHRLGMEEGMFLAKTMFKEPVSEGLEKAATKYAQDKYMPVQTSQAFKAGAKWQKGHLWKLADGDDLPEYDREVIVLVKYSTQRNIHDEEYPTYRVGFGHRPNPDGWDGKNIDTNEVTHYTPKLYDKGGWNAPNIAYWLDVELPKEIEL